MPCTRSRVHTRTHPVRTAPQTLYDGNRYEVECKYTGFVRLASRPTWPRLDMAPLAAALDAMEADGGGGFKWVANRCARPPGGGRCTRGEMGP